MIEWIGNQGLGHLARAQFFSHYLILRVRPLKIVKARRREGAWLSGVRTETNSSL